MNRSTLKCLFSRTAMLAPMKTIQIMAQLAISSGQSQRGTNGT